MSTASDPTRRTRKGRFAKVRTHYEVTVWNQTNGDIEKYVRDATEEELNELYDYYEDEPYCEVVIDREWEEVENDDD